MKSRPGFRIIPLPLAVVEEARRTMTDSQGHPLRVKTCATRVPCRFTLQMVRPGEEVILMSYSPFRLDHPYRETGPIFIRARGDVGYSDVHRWAPEMDPTQRVFRAYNSAEEITDARIGTAEPEGLIAELFANPAADCIHVRSLTYGCFTFKIERG